MPSPESFDEFRPLLFAIAYRMLGSVVEAEDAVQETYLRWRGALEAPNASNAGVRSLRAYLTSVVTRLCIDRLRSARVQRETYIGPWLPEPLLTDPNGDASEPAALAETVSMAFLVLLEKLNPVERAVFLLREVFEYDYPEIAAIVDKSEANCRQIAHRSKQYLQSQRPRFEPSRQARERLTHQFAQACATGDLPGLIALLHRDITVWSDGGGKAAAALNPIHGADRVARFLLGVLQKFYGNATIRSAWVNGRPGFIAFEDGVPRTVVALEMTENEITALHIIRNPEKLGRVTLGAGDGKDVHPVSAVAEEAASGADMRSGACGVKPEVWREA